MAMHIGYRFIDPLAGVFALSAFLPRTSVVFKVSRFFPTHTMLRICKVSV